MKTHKRKRIIAVLAALILVTSILSTMLASSMAQELEAFEVRTMLGYLDLVADQNTRYITSYSQDPETKMITATMQIYHGSESSTESLTVGVLRTNISFNEQVAPYDRATGLLFAGKRSGSSLPDNREDFRKYCTPLIDHFNGVTTTYMEWDNSRGGKLSAAMASVTARNPLYDPYLLIIEPGETLDVIEFYFMPVNRTDVLTTDMFGYECFYEWSTFVRGIPHIGAVDGSLEATDEFFTPSQHYVVSPGSFKVHVERPLPIRADNTSRAIVGYNPAVMEWSTDGVTYYGGMPEVPDEGGTIHVKGLGDSKYSGNDALFGDYKKYVPSKSQVTFEPKPGFPSILDDDKTEEIAVFETDDATEAAFFEQNADKMTPIISIKINASAVTAAVRGGTYNFSLALNEGALDDDVIWLVSNPLLANVDNSGAVTILDRTGTVALTAIDPSSGLSHSIVLRIV